MRRLAFLLLLLLVAGLARADERILSWHSDIRIEADASMLVTETIRVRAEGQEIRRGIYREFPTSYRDRAGHRIRVGFEFLGAERDGQPENARVTSEGNGVNIRLGREEVYLDPGEYTYTIRYRTTRQLGFFDDHDELYWNVTGNGWGFFIDEASARVYLPEPVPEGELSAEGYTGPQGSTERELVADAVDGGAVYRTTTALAPNEGLTIVLGFPKGLVPEPTTEQELMWLLADNRQLLIALGGLLLLLAWYGWRWHRFGRDPAPGVRMPIYEPPKGYSPASLRFVREMGYDRTCFAAAILSLAAKGEIEIEQDEDKTYTLKRTFKGDKSRFAPGERKLLDKLFKGSETTLELKRSSSMASRMRGAQSAHAAALSADYEKKYFVTNRGTVIAGVGISVATLLAGLVSVPGEAKFAAMFICVWLSGWSLGVYGIYSQAITLLRTPGIGSKAGGMVMALFGLPFLAGEIAGLVFLGFTAGVGMVIAFAILVVTNVAFYHWMKAPTAEGARLLDRIEGFRWYLGVAEKDELDARYRPEAHPASFAELLPYALALGVDQAWAKRFEDALPPDRLAEAKPSWYRSSLGGSALAAGGFGSLASGLSSGLSSAISSASTAPGSSSGGGGGGSSGGGGGGGGGGGW